MTVANFALWLFEISNNCTAPSQLVIRNVFVCIRCNTVGKDEEDYRPLFENFLQDLLVTLNKNDWPAAEVLLTLLGRLLVSEY